MKAIYGTHEEKGGVQLDQSGRSILVGCPGCGVDYSLQIPPFTFDRATLSVGPASIKLLPCGWHGVLRSGIWIQASDSICKIAVEALATTPTPEAPAKEMTMLNKGDKVRLGDGQVATVSLVHDGDRGAIDAQLADGRSTYVLQGNYEVLGAGAHAEPAKKSFITVNGKTI